jgi:hypothetical protein
MEDTRKYLVPLALMLAVIGATSRWVAGDLALPIVSLEQFAILGFVLVLTLFHFLFVAAVVSVVRGTSRTRQHGKWMFERSGDR